MLDSKSSPWRVSRLRFTGTTPTGRRASVQSAEVLGVAESRAADLDLFQTQLGRLGGPIYQLADIEATIEGRPMVPMSLLNRLRRELVARLDERRPRRAGPHDRAQPVLPRLLEPILAERDRQRQIVRIARRTGRAIRSVSAHRPDRGGLAARRLDDLRRLPGHQAICRGRRGGPPRSAGRRRSTWRPRASRSPAKPTSSASWPGKGPTESWYATRGA